MGPMRIVTVLTSLGAGGAEKHALAVAERMTKRGHAIAVLSLMPRVAEEWPCACEILHLNMRKTPASLVTGLMRARRFLLEFRPDVVHSHSFHANIFARLLRIGAPRAVVLSTVHNVNEGGRMRMLAYRLTDGLSRRTVVVSAAAADRFARLKAIPQRKCFVLNLGIDTDEFAPDAARRDEVRKAEGAGAKFIWLSAGRLVPAKDFPNLLGAFKHVRSQFPDAELWIAGAPVAKDVNHAAAGAAEPANAMDGQQNIQKGVRWLGFRGDMPALMDAADGFVLASAWEGLPLVLMEAMAMEKTIVATDVGGVRELVADFGVLAPPRDSAALAEAMLTAMRRSGEKRARLGRAARERILRQFSVDEAADRWEAMYQEIVS